MSKNQHNMPRRPVTKFANLEGRLSHRLFIILLLAIAATRAVAEDMPAFKITTRRDNDRVELDVTKDKAIFSIHSPFGISHATIERTREKWPGVVVLRLHTKGLESLRVSNGKVTLAAAVSSQDGKSRLWTDGKEEMPLDASSPYWAQIRMVGADGKQAKAIPLEDGYFEMTLPSALFDNSPKSITVNWIDFFRS